MRRHTTFTKWGEPAVPFLPTRRHSLSIGVCAPPALVVGGAQTPIESEWRRVGRKGTAGSPHFVKVV